MPTCCQAMHSAHVLYASPKTFTLVCAVHLGHFAFEDGAANTYDRAAVCVQAPEANLNIPR